jgi:small subunit ribosomal protein S11
MAQTSKGKKKNFTKIERAKIYIKSSFNNSLISATNEKGDVFAWASTGTAGFKGTRKSTPFAATQTARIVIDKLRDAGVIEMEIYVAGVSTGRDAALRAFGSAGIRISKLKDTTPVPHNGCRPKKPRRV